MIRINITGPDASVAEKETLTAGRVGLQCEFTFDAAWDGLNKIAICEGAEVQDVVLDPESNVITIPEECMSVAGYRLRIGVYGVDGERTIVIPTVWAKVGKIQDSADDGEEISNVTPTVAAQILQNSNNALMLARQVKEDADNGAFKGDKGDTGPVGPVGPVGPGASVEVTDGWQMASIPMGDEWLSNAARKHHVVIEDTEGEHEFDMNDPFPIKMVQGKIGNETKVWLYTNQIFDPITIKDGEPPAVTVEETYYGNKVTFTDGTGPHTINVLDGMTDAVKAALLDLFQHVAYIDGNGQQYYDALYDAFNPVLNVEYITVAFDPGTAVIYNTYELAQLTPYLTVTAHFDDDTTAVVNDYTLSGTLETGTSSITATYGGKSAIFTVNVVEWLTGITAVFTQGSAAIYDTDSLDTLKQYLTVTANYSDSTSATVTDYTLSGTLTKGTSTITVSYGGKTDTFTVTVSSNLLAYWDFTQSLADSVNGNLFTIATATNGTVEQTSNGLVFNGQSGNPYTGNAESGAIFPLGTIIEIEFGEMQANFDSNSGNKGHGPYYLPNGGILSNPAQVVWRGINEKFSGWWGTGWHDSNYISTPPTYFSNQVMTIIVNTDGSAIIKNGSATFATVDVGVISDNYKIKLGWNDAQCYWSMIVKNITVRYM